MGLYQCVLWINICKSLLKRPFCKVLKEKSIKIGKIITYKIKKRTIKSLRDQIKKVETGENKRYNIKTLCKNGKIIKRV